jgi:hypothetical protein
LAGQFATAPTLSTHLLRDPQERRYIEVDHFPSPLSKARVSLAREAIVANRLSRFVETDVKRFKKGPSLLAFWRRFRKLDTIKPAQLARNRAFVIAKTRIATK